MRLFTAIALPDEVSARLDEHLDVLREIRDDLRWVPRSNLHLTVRFLGECGPREADRQIEHWTGRCARIQPFELALRGAGCFPHVWMAKVLYAAVDCDAEAFARLSGGGQPPHVTVARARRKPVDLTGVVDELAGLSSGIWRAEQVTMYQSFIEGGRAPRYVPVETFELGSDDDVAK